MKVVSVTVARPLQPDKGKSVENKVFPAEVSSGLYTSGLAKIFSRRRESVLLHTAAR